LLHHYLCGSKVKNLKAEIIDLNENSLTGASSPLIGDIITHLQPHTLKLGNNNITSVRDISTAVINTNTVKVLNMRINGLTVQEASAISDMMTCLEELDIIMNKLGDDGAAIISEGITKTKSLRVLKIFKIGMTSRGSETIAYSLLHNTSLEILHMGHNAIGKDGATAIAQAITNNKTLKELDLRKCEITTEGVATIMNGIAHNTSLVELQLSDDSIGQDGAKAIAKAFTLNQTLKKFILFRDDTIDKKLAMIIMKSLYHNNSISYIGLPSSLRSFYHSIEVEAEIINKKRWEDEIHIELEIVF